ncbi:hypothetical protein MLD63_13485 [Paracoccus sp. TK19116]|uniref:Glycoside-hydrolase family GH114 TIM-barrel domain-containing protein n=1 Tax=Paracoccus albicereus TaxID=2922394 RepID=A0ABT1MVS6_9RHOB|nr:hypothetical protein [Paracoccus albicereus]MCQ0971433.1 hypothetical protein [Paracoccus albicereus]
MSSARSRAAELALALKDGFGVQYWGAGYDAESLASQPHGLLILEATKVAAPYSDTGHEILFTPDEMALIEQNGLRPALGYLNVSEIADYRDYWIDQMDGVDIGVPDSLPAWYGPRTAHGEHLSVYWTDAWRSVVLAQTDRLMQTGVKGLFLDDVLHYYSHAMDKTLQWPNGVSPVAPDGAPAMAIEMMELVVLIAKRARQWNCNAYIVVNNGVFIGRDAAAAPGVEGRVAFAAYLEAIDGIMVENLSAPSTHPHTIEALQEDFRRHGVAVLSLDVATNFTDQKPEDLSGSIARKAAELGYYPYVSADDVFNQLYPPIRMPSRSLAGLE